MTQEVSEHGVNVYPKRRMGISRGGRGGAGPRRILIVAFALEIRLLSDLEWIAMLTLMPASSQPTSVFGKVGLSLFFAVFLALGLLFFAFMAKSLLKTISTYEWQEVPATIIRSEVTEDSRADEPFRVAVSFRYQWEGRARISEKHSFSQQSYDNYDEAAKGLSGISSGSETVCYVNPQNPDEAILRRDGFWIGLFMAIPLVFVIVGAGGIFYTWRSKSGRAEPLSRSAKPGARRGMVAFGAVFAAVGGALLLFWIIPTITRSLDSLNWKETPCTVISSRVKSHSDSDGTTYSVDVFYLYVFEGREHRSNRYRVFQVSSSGRAGKEAVVKRYPPGMKAVCFVNPKNPSEAVLVRGPGWSALFGLLPLAFLAIGLWVMWSGIQGTKKVELTGAETPPIADGVPRALKPRASPFAKLAATIAVAIFWNGIVSVFLFNLVDGFSRGRPDWFLAVFLVPFVLVGLGLLAATVYSAMAMTNPRCSLSLSPAVLVPGKGFELQWETRGSLHRLSRLLIYVEGREEATYRRGTSSYTDREVFARLPLVDLTSSLEMGQGAARGQLPEGVMTTFEASSNKIVWTLQVRGEISRWPNVIDEYPVNVAMPERRHA